jgi:hypothetical protein
MRSSAGWPELVTGRDSRVASWPNWRECWRHHIRQLPYQKQHAYLAYSTDGFHEYIWPMPYESLRWVLQFSESIELSTQKGKKRVQDLGTTKQRSITVNATQCANKDHGLLTAETSRSFKENEMKTSWEVIWYMNVLMLRLCQVAWITKPAVRWSYSRWILDDVGGNERKYEWLTCIATEST